MISDTAMVSAWLVLIAIFVMLLRIGQRMARRGEIVGAMGKGLWAFLWVFLALVVVGAVVR